MTKYNRTENLKNKINNFLYEITGIQSDYFQSMCLKDLINMKLALSDVNNVLTLKTVLSFSEWLINYFHISATKCEGIIGVVNETKPNSNGYDIEINDDYKIVAEVKCIVPINDGCFYGAAQRNAILDDAIKLIKGKKSRPDTTHYIKLLGLIDLGAKTDSAISRIIATPKHIRTKQEIRLRRHEVVSKIRIFDDGLSPEQISKEYVYIKKISVK